MKLTIQSVQNGYVIRLDTPTLEAQKTDIENYFVAQSPAAAAKVIFRVLSKFEASPLTSPRPIDVDKPLADEVVLLDDLQQTEDR